VVSVGPPRGLTVSLPLSGLPLPRPSEPCRLADGEEGHGSEHSHDEPDDVELPDVSRAEVARHNTSNKGTEDSEQEGERNPDLLPSGEEQPSESTDDQTNEDEAEDLHDPKSTASLSGPDER
jgi:hypothetical protein